MIQADFHYLDPIIYHLTRAVDLYLGMIQIIGAKIRAKEPLSAKEQEAFSKAQQDYYLSFEETLAILREYGKREFPN
jgi:hypothetical protein